MPHRPFQRAALAALLLLAACGERGALTFVAEPPVVGTVETILVATTRERLEGQPVFGSRRADPRFAEFRVSVPPERAPGTVTFPKAQPPDPRTDFVTVSARQLAGEAAFVRAIDAILAADPRSEGTATIFTHGYNTNFAEGLYRHAQLMHDYDSHAANVHFAWPSAGDARAYVFDRESALFSREGYEATLAAMARSRATRINVVAHSMGAFLTMDSLATMARLGYDQVFDKLNAVLLVSPDIEIDVFRKEARHVIGRGVPIFVIVSTRDRALLVSARLRGERERLGSIRSPAELGDIDVRVIDITNVDAGDALGHFALATSPELIGLLTGLRREGVNLLDAEQQQRGPLGVGISLIQQGADIVFSPLQPPVR